MKRIAVLVAVVGMSLWSGTSLAAKAGPNAPKIPITATAIGSNQIEVEGCGFKSGGNYSIATRHYFYVDYPGNPPAPAWEDSLFAVSVNAAGCIDATVTVPNTDIGSAYDIGLHGVWVIGFSGGNISGGKFATSLSTVESVYVY